MKARYLKQNVLAALRDSIPANLDAYREGSFNHLAGDSSNYFEGSFDFNEEALKLLLPPTAVSDFEAENCAACYKALSTLSAYEAREERFWVYITHTSLLGYTRARWPIPLDDGAAVQYIQTHFFAGNKRAIERDNSASRLWWMAHLCHRIDGLLIDDGLKVLHYRTDVRANIIERPTVSQNTQIFGALIKTLKASYDKDKSLFERETFRQMMIKLNSIGGATLLDSMSEAKIARLLSQIVGAGSPEIVGGAGVGKVGNATQAQKPVIRDKKPVSGQARATSPVASRKLDSKLGKHRPKSKTRRGR